MDDMVMRLKQMHGLGFIERHQHNSTKPQSASKSVSKCNASSVAADEKENRIQQQLANTEFLATYDGNEDGCRVTSLNVRDFRSSELTLPFAPTAVIEPALLPRPIRSLQSRMLRLGPNKELLWNPALESLDNFLSVASPSMTWKPCQWITVRNNNSDSPGFVKDPVTSCNVIPIKNILKELEAKVLDNQSITAAEKESAVQRILAVAQSQKFTCGKWILSFHANDRLDGFSSAWRNILPMEALGIASKWRRPSM
jgi:hypothetical protein